MAVPIPFMLVETVNNLYRYFGFDDSGIGENAVFQEPRMSRQNPNKCDLCFPLIPLGGCDAQVPGVLLFPEHRNFKVKINVEKVKEELPVVSEGWVIPVVSCSTSSNTLCILLDHANAFQNTISQILSESLKPSRLPCFEKVIEVSEDASLNDSGGADLTQLRTRLAFKSLCNVFSSLGYKIKTEGSDTLEGTSTPKYHICYKSVCPEKGAEQSLVHCGAVLDVASGVKANDICARDYYRLKKLLFENVAQERDSIQGDSSHSEILAEAEVAAELLGVKLHDHVSVSLSSSSDNVGIARGATFFLYNHVRLSCIRKKFEQEVECGNYSKLPDVSEVDFGLLSQNEEWELLLLTLQFSYWLVNCVRSKGKISLHPILVGMDKLCRVFSVYYRRVRVLTEPRPHLLPVMYARLYLLQSLERILGVGLSIFNMKPLDYM